MSIAGLLFESSNCKGSSRRARRGQPVRLAAGPETHGHESRVVAAAAPLEPARGPPNLGSRSCFPCCTLFLFFLLFFFLFYTRALLALSQLSQSRRFSYNGKRCPAIYYARVFAPRPRDVSLHIPNLLHRIKIFICFIPFFFRH